MTTEARAHKRPAPFEFSCRLYSQILLLYPYDLYFRYGEEMYWVFRRRLRDAAGNGASGYLQFGPKFFAKQFSSWETLLRFAWACWELRRLARSVC